MLLIIIYLSALIQALEVTVWRDGQEFQQKYCRGKPLTNLKSSFLPSESSDRRGTMIKFWPDQEGEFISLLLFDVSSLGHVDT